jgi:hypothetical protein
VVQPTLNQTSHPNQKRADASRHPNAYRRVYTRIPSNHRGSSFDSVRRIPAGVQETVVYSRIRSNRPGTSYDSARRVPVDAPEQTPPRNAAAGPVPAASLGERPLASLRVAVSAWRASARRAGTAHFAMGLQSGASLNVLQT